MRRHARRAFLLITTFGALSLGGPQRASAQAPDPKRWLGYKTLKGSMRVGSSKGEVSLAELWKGTAYFRLDGRFVLRQAKHEEYWGRVEFKGRLEGSVDYRTQMKGVTTEDLESDTASVCGGAIGRESEITLSVNYKDGTYVLNAHAPAKCGASKLKVKTSQGANVDESLGDEMLFSVSPSVQALLKGFPLPTTGKSFSGASAMMIVPQGGLALPMEGSGEWWIESGPPSPKVKVQVVGDPCNCNVEVASFTAQASPGGGKFEPFRVEGAEVLRNEGGAKPRLELVADAQKAKKARVVATYVVDGERHESAALELDFLRAEKPKIANGATKLADSDFAYREGQLWLEAKSGGGWVNGQKKVVQWEILPRQPAFSFERVPGSNDAVKISRDELPAKATDFGPRDLVAQVGTDTCTCSSEPVRFRTFYGRDDTDNPASNADVSIPNWAYYWPQTSAGLPGVQRHLRVAAKMPPALTKGGAPVPLCSSNWTPVGDAPPNVQARYEVSDDLLYFSKNAFGYDCAPRSPIDAGSQGIDCFAELLRHEWHHRAQLVGWWGRLLAKYRCQDDLDGDLVPNDVERATPGCKATDRNSCSGRPSWMNVNDLEFEAYRIGWSWPRGAADGEDWSHPGKNSP